MKSIPGSLRALLANLIDYAGLYPPAALPLPEVAEKYAAYCASPNAWMLNRIVLPAGQPFGDAWRVTLLVDQEPGPLPPQVETLETKLPHRLSLPTYCEAPLDQLTDSFAKVRTGGLNPGAIPSPAALADFLWRSAARKLPFKATAGLHHPVRSLRPLTYAADSPRAVMHGFVNVFSAAAFGWHGAERQLLLAILEDQDAGAFHFAEDSLRWRGHELSTAQLLIARREFAHSFGSCSFEEPVREIHDLYA